MFSVPKQSWRLVKLLEDCTGKNYNYNVIVQCALCRDGLIGLNAQVKIFTCFVNTQQRDGTKQITEDGGGGGGGG